MFLWEPEENKKSIARMTGILMNNFHLLYWCVSLSAMVQQMVVKQRLSQYDNFLVFPGHQGLINDVMFSPDGRLIASASFDKSIKLWDGNTGTYASHL